MEQPDRIVWVFSESEAQGILRDFKLAAELLRGGGLVHAAELIDKRVATLAATLSSPAATIHFSADVQEHHA